MLQKHHDEINQLVYYEANKFLNNDIERHCHDKQEIEIYDALLLEMQQILLNELIYLVEGINNITKVWSDKFYEEKSIEEIVSSTTYLYAFNYNNWDFLKETLNKVLKSQPKSQQLINLLQEFTEKIKSSSNDSSEGLFKDSSKDLSDDLSDDKVDSNKENQEFILLNPKKKRGKG
ncbi:16249_t:CDS:2, partial [Dentiscutata heterogama]